MRSEPSKVKTAVSRTRSLAGPRRETARRQKARHAVLESLESRELLAVLPQPLVSAQVAVASNFEPTNANNSTPSIAVDPTNPQHLAAVWQTIYPVPGGVHIGVDGAYSTDGGASWNFLPIGFQLLDPTTSNPTVPFAQATDGTVDFDRQGNIYVLLSQHNGGNGAGALVLNKFTGTGGSIFTNKVLYSWTADQAIKPTLAVDKGVASFSDTYTDPLTNTQVTKTQTDLAAGNVYVAWGSVDTPPTGYTGPWNPNTIRMIASTDGGNNFGGAKLVGYGNLANGAAQREGAPRIAITQGTATTAGGTPTVTGGSVTVVWDDWGTGAGANPPVDLIQSRTYSGANSATFSAIPGGVSPGGANNAPVTTTFPINVVTSNNFGNLTDLTVTLGLQYANNNALSIVLKAPDGTLVTLVPAAGSSGADFGYNLGSPNALYTNFNQNTFRNLATGAAPYIGTYRPSGNLAVFNSKAVQNGQWELLVTSTDTANAGFLSRASLSFTSAFVPGAITTVATSTVRGQQGPGGLVGSASNAFGIGPAPAIAADNTLGGNSANQGTLYVTYVGRSTADGNPADNTDVFLSVSTDGGKTWVNRGRVNNDTAIDDGYSEGRAGLAGRAQYQPQVAVDQATGTLVVSFLDTRYDAARARVVTTIATSLDGGRTFANQDGSYANASQIAYDEATNTNVNLGPIPENESGGNPNREATFGFGDRQGLAVLAGHVYPAWAGNFNGGDDGKRLLDVNVAQVTIAAGPRVISYTMGPVGLAGDSLNNTTAADGAPQATSVIVQFDRNIDPSTFTPGSDFLIVARDVNGVLLPAGQQPTVTAVTPLDTTSMGATQFRIDFTPSSTPGTYSYSVGPNISDRIRQLNAAGTTVTSTGNQMDQNGNAQTNQPNADRLAVPAPAGGNAPLTAPYVRDQLPLVVPGPHVVSYQAQNQQAGSGDHLVLNSTATYIDVTFDRDMLVSSFTADKVLRIQGPAGLISGPFTVTQVISGANPLRTFRIGFPKQQLSGTYTVTLDPGIKSASGYLLDTNLNAGVDALRGTSTNAPTTQVYNYSGPAVSVAPGKTGQATITIPDNFVLQGLTLQLNITSASDPALTAVLIAPDGTRITLFSGVGKTGTQANFTNTIFDDSATTPIGNGGPPFLGRFRPQQTLSALNNASSVTGPGGTGTGVYTLEVTNAATGKPTTINSWSLTLAKPTSGTGLGEPVADRPQLAFRIFTMDPTNPLASQTWTSVGPASISQGASSRIGGIAVDPSDPSGNTVFVGGASGGVWKTNNFLTTAAGGPTYIPLTDFGPTFGVNVGGIAVFGRNNDPNQSVVFVSTGEGDTGSTGVGVLRSMDGGATWTLLDSTDNTKAFASRDHAFVGSTAFKILVDPRPTPTGNIIVYMALSGNNGGIWRSLDSGQTWGVVNPTTGVRSANLPGQATDLVVDPNSGPIDTVSNPTGNLQIIYAGIRGQGVYISPNQGQSWNLMTGGVGVPLIQDPTANPAPKPVTVGNLGVNPNGANGRIVLAKPDLFPTSDANAAQKNFLYQGWLYAAVVTPNDHLQGLYVTKDQGQNWTRILLPNFTVANGLRLAPSNNTSLTSYDVLGNSTFAQGNYDVSLIVDPTNPNIVYLGGTLDGNPTGLIRVDITGLSDPHSFYMGMDRNDGGSIYINSTDPMTLKKNPLEGVGFFDPRPTGSPTINLIRDPSNPLGGNATFYVTGVTGFANSGAGARWVPFDVGGTDQHRVVAFRDPLTGHARLIFGDDQGVFSVVDDGTGNFSPGIGTAAAATGTRNGNLSITQFYYGAVQPSSAAAQIAGALLYGQAQDNGFPRSDPSLLTNGNISWSGPGGDGTGVATDQTGTGTLYQYNWPCCGGNVTDFFQVNGVGRTNGLIQQSSGGNVPDPQWPFLGGFNFAVNPINGNQIVIGSAAGRLFRTLDQGNFWQVIADPAALDGTTIPALAFGAPDPSVSDVGSLANVIYVGTSGGHIYATYTGGGGGGGQGNAWYNITNGDLTGNGASVVSIVTNPTRGSREAYAVTTNGVYYNNDTNPNSPTADTWHRITGNLFSFVQNPFNNTALADANTGNGVSNKLKYLSSIIADWRYAIPDNLANPSGPTHPMLYVAGEGGVYRSTDKGATWTLFPSAEAGSVDNTAGLNLPGTGGALPNAHVTDLDMSIGNVDPTTGRSVAQPGDPNLLVATTFGRGSFAIRLAPVVFANQVKLDPSLPAPGGSAGGGTATDGTPLVTVSQPVFDGLSEQTAFGNVVRITLWDLTDPNNPRIVGGYDPNTPASDTPANRTNSFGQFSVGVNSGAFTTNGLKSLGIQATDLSGTKGNMALFAFTLKANLSNINNPPVAPTIQMLASDDTSGGQLITRTAQPHIIGVTDPGLGLPTPTATSKVELFRSSGGAPTGAALVTGSTDAQGNFSLLFPNLGDGTYAVQVKATNAFGSSLSPVLTFTIKHNGPTLVPTVGLLPASDTGIVGDWVTANRQPSFTGFAEPGAKVQLYRVLGGVRGNVLATVTADAVTGAFTIQMPQALGNGVLSVQVGETDLAGNPGPYSSIASVAVVTTQGDLTGSGKTTPAVFRRTTAGDGTASWLALGSVPSSGWVVGGVPTTSTQAFGSSALDIPFVGDFDGDGITDTGIYRPSASTWVLNRSFSGILKSYTQGAAGDIPVVADFDGDGVSDTATFRPGTGAWAVSLSSTGNTTYPAIPGVTATAGDVPVPGNYDNTGKDELAVYRPSNGTFYILGPNGLYSRKVGSGAATEVPVPGDYANSFTVPGGQTQPVTSRYTLPAVFDTNTGVWSIYGTGGVVTTVTPNFQKGDIPAPGDYLNTAGVSGSLQPAVYRPSTATFYVNNGTATNTAIALGQKGDIPVTSPLVYRTVLTQPTVSLTTPSYAGPNGDLVTLGRRAGGYRWFDLAGKADPGATVELVNLNNGNTTTTTTADASGNYSISLAGFYNGTYRFQTRVRGLAGNTSVPSATVTVTLTTNPGDYTGANKATQAVFSRSAADLAWSVIGLSGATPISFGPSATSVPLAGDLDADGKTDLLYYVPSTAQWYTERSAFKYTPTLLGNWGWAGIDIPAPADYNGDGMTDIAVYRPAAQTGTDGYWYVALAGRTTGITITPITTAQAGDVPVPGDYDGVGHAEAAIYRPSTGLWQISDQLSSSSGSHTIIYGAGVNNVPVPGAYLSTTHAVQPAVFNTSTGQWFIRTGAGTEKSYQFAPGDVPAPGDYNGDGVTDAVVFRPGTGQWLYVPTGSTAPVTIPASWGTGTFGSSSTVPVNSPYRYRQVTGAGGTLSVLGTTDIGSTARTFSTGTTAPATTATPAPTTTKMNIHAKQHAAAQAARAATRARMAAIANLKAHHLVTQGTTTKKPGQA